MYIHIAVYRFIGHNIGLFQSSDVYFLTFHAMHAELDIV